MNTVCEMNECTGCMACVNICPNKAISIVDDLKSMNAVIDDASCVHCGACTKMCPNNYPVEKREQLSWNQGWAADNGIRKQGSSGGVASSIIAAFITDGGYVCSCVFDDGEFVFLCTDNIEEAKKFAGSKYVKSNPKKVYKEIKFLLASGKKVLFVGLPCQVAGLLNYIPKMMQNDLYTIDLICHGTPSQKLFELYLNQNGIKLSDAKDVKFRQKSVMGLGVNGCSVSMAGTVDRYLISFLKSLNYTDHCYKCQYAVEERVSDLTLGDSWGSEMANELRQGLSLILCQSEKGKKMLESSNLVLHQVDIQNALRNNGNLQHPSVAPKNRDSFFVAIHKGKKYNNLVMKIFPKQCILQIIKGYAIKLKLFTPKG